METDVRLDRQHMEMWRDGDMSFTDLLRGLMGAQVSDDKLGDEFSKREGAWLDMIGNVTKKVVEFGMLALFEKESTKTFMLFGSKRVYQRVCRELIELLNEKMEQPLAKLVAVYCSQGKFGGQELIEQCTDVKNGEKVCVAVF